MEGCFQLHLKEEEIQVFETWYTIFQEGSIEFSSSFGSLIKLSPSLFFPLLSFPSLLAFWDDDELIYYGMGTNFLDFLCSSCWQLQVVEISAVFTLLLIWFILISWWAYIYTLSFFTLFWAIYSCSCWFSVHVCFWMQAGFGETYFGSFCSMLK